jgi:hypothetical protein
VLVVAVIILAAWARMSVGNVLEETGDGRSGVELSGTRIERSFEVGEFTGIEVRGGWRVTVVQGAEVSVAVTADKALMDRITVERSGDTLELGAREWVLHHDARLEAKVTVPSLSRFVVRGGADARIRGFSGDELSVEVAGAADIDGENNRFEQLNLTVEGAGDLDFTTSSAVHAMVTLDGAGNVALTMAGGELTGSIGGVGSVTYGGEVSREAIRVDGVGSVERR